MSSLPAPLSGLPAGVVTPPSASTPAWLVHPAYDLLLVANVLWPIWVWLGSTEGFASRDGLLFWQLYFVTTPHRWITLLLVFGDRPRFNTSPTLFVTLAFVALGVTLGTRLVTGGLTCLLAIDYLWNAWHFASQHHGISRIYSRIETGDSNEPKWEKWAFRFFLLYVIFRVAGTTWQIGDVDSALLQFDFLAATVPVVLLFRAGRASCRGIGGAVVYRLSVCALFLGMLGAVHFHRPDLVLGFATASALFHATEYLAVIGWTMINQRGTDLASRGFIGWLIPRWGLMMAIFLLVFGVGGFWLDRHWLEPWLALNVTVAFLHYAYDGLIWRRPPRRTS